MTKPLVALVGRPNVGKSTLFNRLVGERVAIVEDLPGTTRDRIYGEYSWRGRDVSVVDTGGIIPDADEEITESIYDQAQLAIDEADVIVFLLDARTGITPVDQEIANLLRRAGKPVILAANKTDNVRQELQAVEFHALGLGEPIPISAGRGLNVGELLDRIDEALPPGGEEVAEPDVTRVAIVGRPNVGKSSIVNRLTGTARSVVSDVPGTTRDAVDTVMQRGDDTIVLVDTAGIRRRGKIERGIEKFSVIRAFRAIDRADVAVLVIDATEPLTAQDAHVAGFVMDEAKGLVVAVNKWDLVTKDSSTLKEYEEFIRRELRFLPYVPIVFVSAKTGQRLDQILDLALSIHRERQKRVPTGQLNETVRRALADYPPPSRGGRQIKLFYITQVAVSPPTFVVKVNDPTLVHFSYRRFLENRLRERFGFFGTPIRIHFRARGREAA